MHLNTSYRKVFQGEETGIVQLDLWKKKSVTDKALIYNSRAFSADCFKQNKIVLLTNLYQRMITEIVKC